MAKSKKGHIKLVLATHSENTSPLASRKACFMKNSLTFYIKIPCLAFLKNYSYDQIINTTNNSRVGMQISIQKKYQDEFEFFN